MKQKLLFLLAILIGLPGYVYSFEYTYKDMTLRYEVTDESEKTCKVTGSPTSINGDLEIPSVVTEGDTEYFVTEIGSKAFYMCAGMTSIVLPNSITEIGSAAFDRCFGLTSMILPSNLKFIGNLAFRGCENIVSIAIPNSVIEIGDRAFDYCNIASMSIGAGVQRIGKAQCSPMKVIWQTNTPPEGFSNMAGKNNYTSNDSYIFNEGKSHKIYPFLSSLFEVDGIVYVPVDMVQRTCDIIDCSYNDRAGHIELSNETSYRGIKMRVSEIMPYSFYDNDYIQSLKIEFEGSIPDYAFYSCDKISGNIEFKEGVKNIGGFAFLGCISLESVECRNIGNIDRDAFNSCTNLQAAVIKNGGSLGNNAFNSCDNLRTAVIENGGELGNNAFYGCGALQEINIRSQGKVGSYAFGNCQSASNLIISPSVTSIESNAFAGCSSLSDVTIEEFPMVEKQDDSEVDVNTEAILRLSSNGEYPLFVDCPLDEVFIGRKLEYNTSASSGYSPFYRNVSLRSVTITDEETEIYENEFYGCSNLESVKIGDGVKSFGNYAFSGCSKIKSFEFGRAVETIGDEAFSDCTAMTALVSHSAIPPVCGTEALDDINKWECTLHVPADAIDDYAAASQWNNFFFVLADADTEKYFEFEGLRYYVTDLGRQLCEVVAPENSEMGTDSLSEEPDAQKVSLEIPGQVTFGGFTYTVNGIGENALADNVELTDIVLPETLKYIRKGAFSGCDNLLNLTLLGTAPPDAHEEAFDESHYTTVTLDYPEESHFEYQAHRVWSRFTNTSTSIKDTMTEELEEVARYDNTGKLVNQHYKGLVIIRYSNGISVKTILK